MAAQLGRRKRRQLASYNGREAAERALFVLSKLFRAFHGPNSKVCPSFAATLERDDTQTAEARFGVKSRGRTTKGTILLECSPMLTVAAWPKTNQRRLNIICAQLNFREHSWAANIGATGAHMERKSGRAHQKECRLTNCFDWPHLR